jgi:hypothetical protein
MSDIQIKQYRDFWDVPRIFLVEFENLLLLFDCKFDEDKEDYRNNYEIFLMPDLSDNQLIGSWNELYKKSLKRIGEVFVSEVEFDETRRSYIDSEILFNLLQDNKS